MNVLQGMNNGPLLSSPPLSTISKQMIWSMYKQIYHTFQQIKTNSTLTNNDTNNNEIKQFPIHSIHDIPYPKLFSFSSLPLPVQSHIQKKAKTYLLSTFSLHKRKITIHFISEMKSPLLSYYSHAIQCIQSWLLIVFSSTKQTCSSNLHFYFYMTSLQKQLPDLNNNTNHSFILGSNEINTAFTRTCPEVENEIIVYRQEEWFKVFIHETFHAFALDFSDWTPFQQKKMNYRILSLFHVKSKVNAFESYSEIWAEWWNLVYFVYFQTNTNTKLKPKPKQSNIVHFFYQCLQKEQQFTLFQLVKILHYMHPSLQYIDLISSQSSSSSHIQNTFFKEDTNILSYYVLKMILLYYSSDFLEWCSNHNTISFIQFHRTNTTLSSFVSFLQKRYQSPLLLQDLNQIFSFFMSLHSKKTKKDIPLLYSLRMTYFDSILLKESK